MFNYDAGMLKKEKKKVIYIYIYICPTINCTTSTAQTTSQNTEGIGGVCGNTNSLKMAWWVI